jgi:hypothetical protein
MAEFWRVRENPWIQLDWFFFQSFAGALELELCFRESKEGINNCSPPIEPSGVPDPFWWRAAGVITARILLLNTVKSRMLLARKKLAELLANAGIETAHAERAAW